MKKVFLLIAVLLPSSFILSAQESAKDRLSEIEEMVVKDKAHRKVVDNELFSFEFVDHLTYGVHLTNGELYNSKFFGSGEVDINILKFRLNPASWLGFSLGVDFKYDYFSSRNGRFQLFDDGALSLTALSAATDYDTYKSSIRLYSVAAPLLVKFNFGDVSVGGGAEIVRSFSGNTLTTFSEGKNECALITRGAKPKDFTYDIIGAIDLDGLTIYGKYYPKGNEYLPSVSYWTVGIGFDFL